MLLLQELIDVLEQAVADRDQRVVHIKRFQERVWAADSLDEIPDVSRVLSELAYDLEFFEPDDRIRAEEPKFYGDARLEEEIKSALNKLRSLD